MKLEQQIVSLELSKRLKELGVAQISFYCWNDLGGFGNWHITSSSVSQEYCDEGEDVKIYSAFTVSELGEMLPPYFHTHRLKDGKWKGATDDDIADTEADARARMVINMLVTGITTVEEVNQRLTQHN